MAPAATPPRAAAIDDIDYVDLYARWERGNWSATAIDFTQDKLDWEQRLTADQRRGALWFYSLFFHGEDAVTDGLAPYIEAAPLEEQKYFIATQQVDEARHAVFFKRFFDEVVGLGDGTLAGGMAATDGQLTWGHRQVFAYLEEMAHELHHVCDRLRRFVRLGADQAYLFGSDSLPLRKQVADDGSIAPAQQQFGTAHS